MFSFLFLKQQLKFIGISQKKYAINKNNNLIQYQRINSLLKKKLFLHGL
jgi:hypothetical protein